MKHACLNHLPNIGGGGLRLTVHEHAVVMEAPSAHNLFIYMQMNIICHRRGFPAMTDLKVLLDLVLSNRFVDAWPVHALLLLLRTLRLLPSHILQFCIMGSASCGPVWKLTGMHICLPNVSAV